MQEASKTIPLVVMSDTSNQSKASGPVHRCMPTLLSVLCVCVCVCVCVFQIQEYMDLCVGTCGHNDLLFKASSTHLEAV